MKRRAIIVATPEYPGSPLPGTMEDVVGWRSFLASPEGGAWEQSEIEFYTDPGFAALQAHLLVDADPSLDYALLAFSGHGEHVQSRYGSTETRLGIKPGEWLTETSFTLKAKRELIIMDACRQLRVEKEPMLMKKLARANESLTQFSAVDRFAKSRRLFEEAIEGNPTGRSFVYSCSVNQSANDSPSFTKILIAETINQVTSDRLVHTVAIDKAFQFGASGISSFKQPQSPVYEGGRRLTHLPFAVSV